MAKAEVSHAFRLRQSRKVRYRDPSNTIDGVDPIQLQRVNYEMEPVGDGRWGHVSFPLRFPYFSVGLKSAATFRRRILPIAFLGSADKIWICFGTLKSASRPRQNA